MSKKLPQELQANIKSLRIMALIMAVCGSITIIGIPWAILYIGLALMLSVNRLPSKGFLVFVALATIPVCIFIAPVFFEIALWQLAKKVGIYNKQGPTAIRSTKEWKNAGYWQKYGFPTGMVISLTLMIIMVAPVPHTKTRIVDIPYSVQYTQDGSIELGDSQVRQPGSNGQGLERTKQIKPLLALALNTDLYYSTTNLPTQTTSTPVSQIIAQGTKRYQYMWCSNGTYRYYTNDQFDDPSIGFTHKSEDQCNKTGNGHMTGIADTAPPQQTTRTVYQPSYRYTPTYTTCQQYTYINQFSCTTY